VDQENAIVADEEPSLPIEPLRAEPQRGFVAEWTITIILLLFGSGLVFARFLERWL